MRIIILRRQVYGPSQASTRIGMRLSHNMRILTVLLVLSPLLAQDLGVSRLLAPDQQLEGPGVRVRLTPSGVSYVTTVVAKAVTREVATAAMPIQLRPVTLTTLPVTASNPRLRLFREAEQVIAETVAPNTLRAHLKNMNVSVINSVSGMVGSTPINGQLEVFAGHFELDVVLAVHMNARGNPIIRVVSCHVPNHIQSSVTFSGMLSPQDMQQLASAGQQSAVALFEGVICPRLNFITESRINQRFGLLSPKITLQQSAHFDLMRSLIEADKVLRRSIRQDMPMRAPQVPRAHIFRHRVAAQKRQARQARQGRQESSVQKFVHSFNLSRTDKLALNYGMTSNPVLSPRGIELETSGEITSPGLRTPFGPQHTTFPQSLGKDMLQLVVADYVPNTLMYHGHRVGLFNTRVDPTTPHFGSVMRTTCDMATGALFCVGDLFPTLREVVPNREMIFLFSTLKAPAIIVKPEDQGGIHFDLLGLIEVLSIDPATRREIPVGAMEIMIEAKMKMRITGKAVRGKVSLDTIVLKTRNPNVLIQEELDDAGLLSREILQRMVNDILKQGVPIPVHPLFKLHKPTMKLMNRALLLETSFTLNQKLVRQLTTATLS